MPAHTITVSPAFRKLAVKVVCTIVLFIITYLTLFTASVGLTILCGWLALIILSASVSGWAIALSLGLMLMGGMITYFLLKFIFARHTADRTGLTEITREQEPGLFAMVQEIVGEVKTDFPKKIYLSADVNAAVFYDSSFWSMIFPARKNLQIGIGLVNSTTQLELKAILAHEFGHFSQRSMKLGSFVYNVNQVIFNMLYDNETYNENVSEVADMHWFFKLFTNIAGALLEGVQWILRKNYNLINLTYMGLSREMEFHADQVAATVTGSAPLISSMLRMDMASDALNRVRDVYNSRYQESLNPANIYTQQRWMMAYISRSSSLQLRDGLPVVTEAHFERYSKSKLVIKNQWASHPATEDRIAALHKLFIQKTQEDIRPANLLFQDIIAWQEYFTKSLFAGITYPGKVVIEADAVFERNYEKRYPLFVYPALFNGYFDRWHLTPGLSGMSSGTSRPAILFSDAMSAMAASLQILEGDKAVLHELTVVEHCIKTFDYDGVKYNMDNIYSLTERLDGIIADHRRRLEENDGKAIALFRSLAVSRGEGNEWEAKYAFYSTAQQQHEALLGAFNALVQSIWFMREPHAFAQIQLRLPDIAHPERQFRKQLGSMLTEEVWRVAMRPEQQGTFIRYLANDHVYFTEKGYDKYAISLLFNTLEYFPAVLAAGRDGAKLRLLEACADIVAQPARV